MIWAKEETLPREEIERIQLTKLKDTVRYIYDRVKPYREKMDMAGVSPDDLVRDYGCDSVRRYELFVCTSGRYTDVGRFKKTAVYI